MSNTRVTASPETAGGHCKPANAEPVYRVAAEDLPVSCPLPEMCLWNSHPRVYLAFNEEGRARCPYCGAEYLIETQDNQDKPL